MPFQVEVRPALEPECEENYKLEDSYFFVSGDNAEPTNLGMTQHHIIIHQDDIIGVNPKVVTNWSNWVPTLSYFIEM